MHEVPGVGRESERIVVAETTIRLHELRLEQAGVFGLQPAPLVCSSSSRHTSLLLILLLSKPPTLRNAQIVVRAVGVVVRDVLIAGEFRVDLGVGGDAGEGDLFSLQLLQVFFRGGEELGADFAGRVRDEEGGCFFLGLGFGRVVADEGGGGGGGGVAAVRGLVRRFGREGFGFGERLFGLFGRWGG